MSFQTRQFEIHQNVTINAIVHPVPSKKPTLIFLHYWGGSSRMWLPVMKRLSSYPSIALDFRGWGDSTGPHDEAGYSISMLASDIEKVIKEMELDSFVLAGLSMGGKVAQVIAAHNPPGLKSVILLSPAPLTPFQLPEDMREQQIHAYDTAESATFVAANVLTASARGEVVAALVEDQLKGNEWAKAAWPKYGMAEDYGELSGSIAVPVLVLAAEKDVVEPVERVREVFEKIGTQWGIIEGSSHLSPVECVEDVARAIEEFVGREALA